MPTITRTVVVTDANGKQVAKKKTFKVSQETLARAKARQALKKGLDLQPEAVKKATMMLLPQSRRQVADKIRRVRLGLEKVQSQLAVASDPLQKAELEQTRAKGTIALAALVATARKKQQRAAGAQIPGVVKVDLTQAKARYASSSQAVSSIEAKLKDLTALQKARKGTKAVMATRAVQIRLLLAQRSHLKRRLTLLKRGLDYAAGPKIPAGRARVIRRQLVLPALYVLPKPEQVKVLVRLIARGIQRRLNENDAFLRFRMKAYIQRAILRFVKKRSEQGVPEAAALEQAALETLQEDAPAIESEVDAGGIVEDPVAEGVDLIIEDGDVDEAIEDFNPEVPASEPSPAVTAALLQEAAVVEAQEMQAPLEEVDLIELPSEGLVVDEGIDVLEEVTPLWKRPIVWGAAGALVLLLALVRR